MQKYSQLYQLRQDLLEASSVKIEGETLWIDLDQPYQIYLVNGKVIRTPGTLIYFVDVQDCHFYQRKDRIILSLSQNGQEEEWMIGYVR